MINMLDYMQELKRKVRKLPHVKEITQSDMMFIEFITDNNVVFEISMVQFNEARFAITFDIGVVGSNSKIANISWIEFTNKNSPYNWEEIYLIEKGQ